MNSLPFFHSILILTRCNVTIYQGPSEAIHIDESKDIAKWIDYHVENSELTIQTKPMYYGYLLLNNCYPKISITCVQLNGIQLFDRAHITTPMRLIVKHLGVINRQRGMIELDLDAQRVDCTVLKDGRITVKGETVETCVHGYHNGRYDGTSLQASEGRVYLTGNAQASVLVDGELEAQVSGRGKLSYHGDTKFSQLRVDEGCCVAPYETRKDPRKN